MCEQHAHALKFPLHPLIIGTNWRIGSFFRPCMMYERRSPTLSHRILKLPASWDGLQSNPTVAYRDILGRCALFEKRQRLCVCVNFSEPPAYRGVLLRVGSSLQTAQPVPHCSLTVRCFSYWSRPHEQTAKGDPTLGRIWCVLSIFSFICLAVAYFSPRFTGLYI